MTNTSKRVNGFLGSRSAVLLTGLLASIALVTPTSSQAAAATSDMPALMFPPVSVNSGQHLLLCGSDMGEVPVSGVIGLLDVTDTTKSIVAVPFNLKPNTGTCTRLAAGSHGSRADVIAYVAFPPDTSWNSTSGKAFVASLQVREGNSTTMVLVPTFMPAIPIPQTE